MTREATLEAMRREIGQEDEPGAWFTVDQALIDRFVAISGETSWIHTDPERARQETTFGGTIAPGNMGIALMPHLSQQTSAYNRHKRRYALNQGWDRIRYLSPLVAGSTIRSRSRLVGVEERADGSLRVAIEFRIEVQGREKPWVIGTKVGRFFF